MAQDQAAPGTAGPAAGVATEDGSASVSILEQIIANTKATQKESGALVARGVRALLKDILDWDQQRKAKEKEDPKQAQEEPDRVDRNAVDKAIAELDKKLSEQMSAILHNKEFKEMESAWRGLKFLVDRTDFRQNIKVALLHAKKGELREDFNDATSLEHSGLYYHVHRSSYGQFGGIPYGAIIGNYDFGPRDPDVRLLGQISSVAQSGHAPFIAAAGAEFFGLEKYTGLPQIKDVKGIFEGVTYTAWRGFRDSEDARYVGLTMPRFLLRMPYGQDNPTKTFVYKEEVEKDHDSYLWGNTAFAFASRLTDSFAKYRWCPNIIGPQAGGTVDQLPVHLFQSPDGELAAKIPTEVLIPEVLEYDLSEEGFIALTMRKDSDNACFFSANSAQKPLTYGQSPEGKAAETNARLGAQLPYMFVISRLAHYIKVLQRELLGKNMERKDLQDHLEKWISQYITADDNPMPGIREKRPLRWAEIKVDSVEGRPGWYRVGIKVRPHFKYMGAFFTLSLVGQQGPAK